MDTKQVISSSVTAFYKYVFPALWLGLFGYVALKALMSSGGDASRWVFVLFWLAGMVFTIWLGLRLKIVSADARFIYASGYWREARIPLSDIASVEESSGLKPKQITLRLRAPSAIGQKVVFIPELRAFETWRVNHPIVAELNRKIKAEVER